MTSYSYPYWPPLYGINIVDELSQDNMYMLPRNQTMVFKFMLEGYDAVQIAAGQTQFYDTQQNTISGWASDAINGRSITISPNSHLARISLQAEGFHWLFYADDTDPKMLRPPADLAKPELVHYIKRDGVYYMNFQNLQNADNGLYVRFTYITT